MKGIIVAAGYGSRFLPVTRVVPKELLPILDRPAIDLVVSEMVEAGVDDLLVISSRRKRGVEDWFDRDPELEARFPAERLGRPEIRTMFVRQLDMKGTGHALHLARGFVSKDEPVLVAFPDDLFAPAERNVSQLLVDTWRRTGCTVLSAGDLAGEDVSRYGVLDVEERDGALRVRGIVEKPRRGTEPSTIVSWGRYLFTPDLFEHLEAGLSVPRDGEYFATDAIQELCRRDRVAAALVPQERWDTGIPLGYVKTVISVALDHPELGGPLRKWLKEQSTL